MNNSRYINALLALFSAIVCLIALELVVRWRLDIDLLTISDLRGGGVGVIESSQAGYLRRQPRVDAAFVF